MAGWFRGVWGSLNCEGESALGMGNALKPSEILRPNANSQERVFSAFAVNWCGGSIPRFEKAPRTEPST